MSLSAGNLGLDLMQRGLHVGKRNQKHGNLQRNNKQKPFGPTQAQTSTIIVMITAANR